MTDDRAASFRAGRSGALVLAAAAISAGIGLAPVPASAQGFGFATFSAVVKANGSTARGSGVKGSSRPETGRYVITFTRPVKTCAYATAMLGDAGGQASVRPVQGKGRRLEVSTLNKSGLPANRGFTLLVGCV